MRGRARRSNVSSSKLPVFYVKNEITMRVEDKPAFEALWSLVT
jgi:hypothetical protein